MEHLAGYETVFNSIGLRLARVVKLNSLSREAAL